MMKAWMIMKKYYAFLYYTINILRDNYSTLKNRKKHRHYYNPVISVIEYHFNTKLNPLTNEPWINLVTVMQQLVGIFGNKYHPEMA